MHDGHHVWVLVDLRDNEGYEWAVRAARVLGARHWHLRGSMIVVRFGLGQALKRLAR